MSGSPTVFQNLIVAEQVPGKIGQGVARFSVRTADFGSRCFWVNRTDGTTQKFSLKACVWD
jgi:hypothetical protein